MGAPLQEKLRAWRRFVLRTAGEFAAGMVFLGTVGAVLAISVADYACHRALGWDAAGWYPIFWGATATLAGWCGVRAVRFLRKFPRTDMDAVRFLRENPPADGAVPGTLGSAVEFLAADDGGGSGSGGAGPGASVLTGSVELRKAVIDETYAEIASRDLRTAVFEADFWRRRWWMRAAVAAVLVVCVLTAVFYPEESRAAVRRWATFGEARWPGRWMCRWAEAPAEMLRGDDFLARVEVVSRKSGRAAAPDYVNVAVFANRAAGTENAAGAEHTLPSAEKPEFFRVQPVDGAFWVRIPRVTESFCVAACAPGEAFSWEKADAADGVLAVRVRPRPCLVNSVIRVIPPEYTGQGGQWYDGGWMLRGLPGTRVGILATADRELASARILLSDGTWATGRVRAENPRQVMFHLEIRQSCQYALEMVTADGITQRLETWRMEMLEDAPPGVTVLEPRPGRMILPSAAVQMKMRVRDDYGLQKMGFRWMLQRAGEVLAEDAPSADDAPAKKKERWTNFDFWPAPGVHVAVDVRAVERGFLWNLTQIRLAPGVAVRFQAYAEDGFRQRTEGGDVFLEVISPEEMGARVSRRWLEVTHEIRRMTELFQEAARKLEAGTPREVGGGDTLREVQALFFTAERLLDPKYTDSLSVALTEMMTDLEENMTFTLPGGESSRGLSVRVRETRRVLDEIREERLPAVQQAVTDGLKSGETGISRAALRDGTWEIVRLLTPMIQRFMLAENAVADVTTLARLEMLQREIMAETETLYVENAGVLYDFLEPAARWELDAVMPRQYGIFERLAEILSRLKALPAFPEDEKDAIFLAAQRNQLARVTELQRKVFFYLRELQAGLRASGVAEVESARMKWMREFAEKLEKFAENQRFLHAACAGFAQPPEALTAGEARAQCAHFAEIQAEISRELTPFLRGVKSENEHEKKEIRLPVSVHAVLEGVLKEVDASRAEFAQAGRAEDAAFSGADAPYADAHTAIFEKIAPAQTQILERLKLLLAAVAFSGDEVPALLDEQKRQAKNENPENGGGEKAPGAEIPPVTVYDVQLLKEMQQETLTRTRAAAEAELSTEALAKAAETLLARQSETLLLAQNTLGAHVAAVMAARNAVEKADENAEETTPQGTGRRNDAFSSILEQMAQVETLFRKYELGPLNTGIQREIVLALESCLRRRGQDPENVQLVEVDADAGGGDSDPATPGMIPENDTPPESQNGTPEPHVADVPPEFHPPLSPSEWGKLPLRMRKQMEALPPQEWPPAYRAMIEEYFRILAREGDSARTQP